MIIPDPQRIRQFVHAGRATFTLRSVKTDRHFTYKVTSSRLKPVHFVAVLTGSTYYTYCGLISEDRFQHTAKGMQPTAPSYVAFQWFYGRLMANLALTDCEFWHEGKCAKCGRPLTDPLSISRGFGPHCYAIV